MENNPIIDRPPPKVRSHRCDPVARKTPVIHRVETVSRIVIVLRKTRKHVSHLSHLCLERRAERGAGISACRRATGSEEAPGSHSRDSIRPLKWVPGARSEPVAPGQAEMPARRSAVLRKTRKLTHLTHLTHFSMEALSMRRQVRDGRFSRAAHLRRTRKLTHYTHLTHLNLGGVSAVASLSAESPFARRKGVFAGTTALSRSERRLWARLETPRRHWCCLRRHNLIIMMMVRPAPMLAVWQPRRELGKTASTPRIGVKHARSIPLPELDVQQAAQH